MNKRTQPTTFDFGNTCVDLPVNLWCLRVRCDQFVNPDDGLIATVLERGVFCRRTTRGLLVHFPLQFLRWVILRRVSLVVCISAFCVGEKSTSYSQHCKRSCPGGDQIRFMISPSFFGRPITAGYDFIQQTLSSAR